MIDAIGTAISGEGAAAGLSQIAPYDSRLCSAMSARLPARSICTTISHPTAPAPACRGISGRALSARSVLSGERLDSPGLWRLREIAPDRFYQGEYYRSYYAQTGLAEEIGYLLDINSRLGIVVSLMRREKKFSNAEVKALKRVFPVVDAACRQHWCELPLEQGTQAPDMENRIEHAFRSIGEGILTPRERQVVELTLRGHSAEAIGDLLEISSGTVRIHRRNIYAKLRISSQGELFSLFIEAMVRHRCRFVPRFGPGNFNHGDIHPALTNPICAGPHPAAAQRL